MARVLFVVKELKMEPLGIMYLSAALKAAGHEVDLVRCDQQDPVAETERLKPDFIAFSVCSGLEEYYANLACKLIRQVEGRILYGGPSVTFSPEKYNGVLRLRGEGEVGIVDLVEGRKPKHLQLVDVNAIPMADREIIYQFEDIRNNPIKNIISRRGCVYACSYCFNRIWNRLHSGQYSKGRIRYRTVESVVAEGRQIKDSYPVKLINFVDDNFVTDYVWLAELAAKWPKEVGLPFFCSVRPDDVTDYNMGLIARAGGAVINMAIESANNENRGRVLCRTGSKEAVRKAIDLVGQHGMRSRLQNIIGLPVEDPLADAYETLDFNISCQPTSSWCALLQAYEGTKVHKIAEEGDYLSEDRKTDDEFFGHSMLKIKDRRKIERLHKIWHVVVRYTFLRRLVPLLIRLPVPFFMWKWFFRWTKKLLAEKELWQVFN